MEKVWNELKKIESNAEQINAEAKEKSKQIETFAEQKSEKLVASARIYATEEAERERDIILKQTHEIHDQNIRKNQQNVELIRENAQRRMKKATNRIFSAIVGEAANGSDNKVR